MSGDNQYYKRLESLFSETDPAEPEPKADPTSRLESELDALRLRLAELEAAVAATQLRAAPQTRPDWEAVAAPPSSLPVPPPAPEPHDEEPPPPAWAESAAAPPPTAQELPAEPTPLIAPIADSPPAPFPPAPVMAEPPTVIPEAGDVVEIPAAPDQAPERDEVLLEPGDLPAPPEPAAPAAPWRERLLTLVSRAALALGILTAATATFEAWLSGQWWIAIAFWVGVAILAGAALFRFPYRLRAGAILIVLYAVGAGSLLATGLRGEGNLLLVAFALLAALTLGRPAGLAAVGLSVITVAAIGWAAATGAPFSNSLQVGPAGAPAWAATVLALAVLAALGMAAMALLQRAFHSAEQREQSAREALEQERQQQARRVRDRSQVAERRTRQILAGAEIAHLASTELQPDDLLRLMANLIRDRFDLYYVGVFLLDDAGQFAVLHSGTGEAGQTMVAKQHRLEVGGNSMIGAAIATRRPRIALDVGKEAVRFNNPLLPLTRSEMALPLIARDRALGALTIQSDQPEAFSEEDIVSLQGMADLMAVAIDNARLFQEAQRALAEVTSLHQRYLSQAWTQFATRHGEAVGEPLTYVQAADSFSQGQTVALPNIEEAIAVRRPVVTSDRHHSTVTVPLKLRDQIIGAFALESDNPGRAWDPGELALVEAVAEQAALALENARLIEEAETALAEARRLAAREQAINVISDKVRRLPDVNTILTTALQELGRSLGATQGQVRLGPPPGNGDAVQVNHD